MSCGALMWGNMTMNALYSLDDVVEALENSLNLNRIKKLLYFVAYGKWEGNKKTLTEVNLKTVISDILNLDLSLEDLDSLLKNICSKINKQAEYLDIANQVLQILSPLYAESSEDYSATSTSLLNQINQPKVLIDSNLPDKTGLSGYESDQETFNYELFEVRLKLVQRTNPLRVKILIFSALQNKVFAFSEPEWSALKNYGLDRLLKNLLENCPNKKNLENLLYKTAKTFKNKNETIQVASAIVKYLTPLYKEESSNIYKEDSSTKPISSPVSPVSAVTDSDISEDQTAPVNGYSENKIQPENQEKIHENNGMSSSSKLEEENFQLEQDTRQLSPSENDITITEWHSSISEQVQDLSVQPENNGYRSVNLPNNSQPASHVGKFKITETLKRHLELEEEIKTLVNHHVNLLMQEIETGLSQLENFLDDRLQGEESVKAFSLKYKSLKEMILQMQGNTSKYLDLLNQMHEAEIQQTEPSQVTQATASSIRENSEEKSQDQSADEPEAKVMELAKQGNAKAIAALMNHILKGRNINTLATIKNDCLHVVLESEQKPNQKASINLVRKNVVPLQLASITKVKVHWVKTGSKSPDWSHEFTYTVDG